MHSFLKQSTASQSRSIGPFLDDTDFKTEETGLAIANTDIKLMINGAASANKNSGGGTHRANGVYGLTFDATDTATVGEILLSVKVAGALPVFATFVVVEEVVYDMLFAASAIGYISGAKVDVDTIKTNPVVNGGTITFPTTATLASTTNITAGTLTTATNVTTVNGLAANVVTAASLAADAGAEIADAVWDEDTSGHTTAGTFGQQLFNVRSNTAQAGAAGSITLDASASATASLYYGSRVEITAGTGVGQSRLITSYNGGTKVASVKPDWVTAPDNTSVFLITKWAAVDVEQWSSSNIASPDTAGYPKVTIKDGTGTGEIDTSSGGVLVSSIAAGGIASTSFAAGAIDAAAIAADAIGSSELAATAASEIATAVAAIAMADPSAVPAVTATLQQTLSWLLALSRNKVTQTSTEQKLYQDDGSTLVATSTQSDDATTYVRGEFA